LRTAAVAAVGVAVTSLCSQYSLGAAAPEPLNADPDIHWFGSWDQTTAPGPTDFFATPSSQSGLSVMATQLVGSAIAGKPLAIKVEGIPMQGAVAGPLFNTQFPPTNKAISYVFTDFEASNKGTNLSNIATTVGQVRGSSVSTNAYVGGFDLAPLTSSDPFRRGALTYTKTDYDLVQVNMANTVLYPGSPTYRNTSTGDWGNPNNNIRTGLFVGPIGRMTAVQSALNASYNGANTTAVGLPFHKQVPYVARFNNWNNSSLDNDPSPGFQFHPGRPLGGLTATQTTDQMMGRGDFSAQIMHYRMRGAYSVMLLGEGANSGVEGYSSADAQQDVRDGWYGASDSRVNHANNIFNQPDNKVATMTLNPIIAVGGAPVSQSTEVNGTIWSGVYSLSLKQLDILASNLDSAGHILKFGTVGTAGVDATDVFTIKTANGYTFDQPDGVGGRSINLEAGFHRLLQFDLVTTRVYKSAADLVANNSNYDTKQIWLVNQNYQVFSNNAGRNDVGIPEPTTFGMLAAAGSMAVICRRNRSKKIEA